MLNWKKSFKRFNFSSFFLLVRLLKVKAAHVFLSDYVLSAIVSICPINILWDLDYKYSRKDVPFCHLKWAVLIL